MRSTGIICPGQGRFLTVDPYVRGAGIASPAAWNRYAYTRGDPINRVDRFGTCDEELLSTGSRAQPVASLGADDGDDDDDDDDDCGGPVGDSGCIASSSPFVPTPPDPTCGPDGPSDPPPNLGELECNYVPPAVIEPLSLQLVTGPSGIPTLAYASVVTLNFTATGRTGVYSFNVTQTKTTSGFIVFGNGSLYTEPNEPQNDPVLAGQLNQDGQNLSFTDTPGLAINQGKFPIVTANVTWTVTTQVSVTSGGVTVDCPIVEWKAYLIWKTVRRGPSVTGGASVTGVVPPIP